MCFFPDLLHFSSFFGAKWCVARSSRSLFPCSSLPNPPPRILSSSPLHECLFFLRHKPPLPFCSLLFQIHLTGNVRWRFSQPLCTTDLGFSFLPRPPPNGGNCLLTILLFVTMKLLPLLNSGAFSIFPLAHFGERPFRFVSPQVPRHGEGVLGPFPPDPLTVVPCLSSDIPPLPKIEMGPALLSNLSFLIFCLFVWVVRAVCPLGKEIPVDADHFVFFLRFPFPPFDSPLRK